MTPDNEKSVVIRIFTSIGDACLAKDTLAEAGIACVVNDTNSLQLYPMFTSQSGIRLSVLENDAEQAESILKNLNL